MLAATCIVLLISLGMEWDAMAVWSFDGDGDGKPCASHSPSNPAPIEGQRGWLLCQKGAVKFVS